MRSWGELAEEVSLVTASADVRLIVLPALQWPALAVEFGAGCDRAVLSRMAFDGLELDSVDFGADGEGVQHMNWTIGRNKGGSEEWIEEVVGETLKCGLEWKDSDASAVKAVSPP
jgi:hypothetical protein